MKTKQSNNAKANGATRARECGENAKITTATVSLADFVENPENPSVATDEDISRLAGKLKRVPLGLTAMRIAYVTDAIEGKRMVISGNKRLRVLKQAFGEDGEVPSEWFADVTAMSYAERHEFIVTSNVSDGEWDVDKLLAQYGREELPDMMKPEEVERLLADVVDDSDEFGTDFSLADGERSTLCTMSFTLSQEQVNAVKQAMDEARERIETEDCFGNENRNGNALYRVVKEWAEQKKLS